MRARFSLIGSVRYSRTNFRIRTADSAVVRFGRGRLGAQQPTAQGQRQPVVGRHLGVVGVLQEGRHAIQRVVAQLRGNFLADAPAA